MFLNKSSYLLIKTCSWERSHAAVQQLLHFVPKLQDYLDNADPNDLKEFYTGVSTYIPLKLFPVLTIKFQLQKGANDARGDDVLSVREAVANWLNKAYPAHTPLDISSRADRGIKHETTGWLLCPIEYDWTDERQVISLSCYESILNHTQVFEPNSVTATLKKDMISRRISSSVVFMLITRVIRRMSRRVF
jgi:hypothetical protein